MNIIDTGREGLGQGLNAFDQSTQLANQLARERGSIEMQKRQANAQTQGNLLGAGAGLGVMYGPELFNGLSGAGGSSALLGSATPFEAGTGITDAAMGIDSGAASALNGLSMGADSGAAQAINGIAQGGAEGASGALGSVGDAIGGGLSAVGDAAATGATAVGDAAATAAATLPEWLAAIPAFFGA
jgi:hypothetical protein